MTGTASGVTAEASKLQRFTQFTLDHSADAVYWIRRDGSFLYVNQTACDMLGYSRPELLALNIFDINSGVSPGRWEQVWEALLEQKQRTFPSEHNAKDGRKITVEVTASLFDLDGEQFSCAVSRDVSARRAAEAEYRREHEFVESLIETAPVMILLLDGEGRVLRLNRCGQQTTGFALDELRGCRWVDTVVAQADRAEAGRLLEQSFAGANQRGAVCRIRTKAGVLRDIVWHDRLIGDTASLGVGLLVVGQDVTEQRDLEHRLRQAEKMEAIGRLAGGIAHDFNNQLTGIMGWLDVMRSIAEDSPRMRECIQGIALASQRSAELTGQLLAYSRKGKYVVRTVDLHDLVREAAAMLRQSIDKPIEIVLDLRAPTPYTVGDPTLLGNAILNVAINARDAMPKGGTLTFATAHVNAATAAADGSPESAGGPFLELTVSDTGIGMDEETQRHIFEPFFTTKAEGRGTGMGLPAVYGTVKGHRGTISVTSNVDLGTQVQIRLPIASHEMVPTAPDRAGRVTDLSGRRILVVDDERPILEVTARLLRHLGCEVQLFDNGFDAVEHFKRAEHPIDVVILDMIMPLFDGKATYYALRKIDPTVRVIVMSGFMLDGAAQAMFDEGLRGFMPKPFTLAALADAISQALQERPASA